MVSSPKEGREGEVWAALEEEEEEEEEAGVAGVEAAQMSL